MCDILIVSMYKERDLYFLICQCKTITSVSVISFEYDLYLLLQWRDVIMWDIAQFVYNNF